MTTFRTVRVAAVQATPVILDAEASVHKAARLIGAKSLAGSYIRLVRSPMFTPSAPAPAIPMV